MVRAKDRLTDEQVREFIEGHPVRLTSGQLTALIRYMASSTPVAVTRIEDDGKERIYVAVSIRRIPGAGELAEKWLQQVTTAPEDNLEEAQKITKILQS